MPAIKPPRHPHALAAAAALHELAATARGLSAREAADRLAQFGRNALPRARAPGAGLLFLRQFKSPLIYVLLAATLASLLLRDWSDAGFILAVLLVNATIGTYQEYSAERSAEALRSLVAPRAIVERGGISHDIDAELLVPGDIAHLESGVKIPADLRLISAQNLSVDESLLTGESLTVAKDADIILPPETAVAERVNMAFAGTMVTSGRARGVVVASGIETALGRIAASVLGRASAKPPLIVRMERFTRKIAVAVGAAALVVALVALARGATLAEVVVLAVALAVSAIPEGLPVALTVSLAIGMQRMARRNVIVRRLAAVEALGSCTQIASDKTGTLTVNRLTVRRIQLPGEPAWEVTGEGLDPHGIIAVPEGADYPQHSERLVRLACSAVLASNATVAERDGRWTGQGDSVDVALLVFARKARVEDAPATQIDAIPYECEQRYCASLNKFEDGPRVSVKGAVQTVLDMCAAVDAGAILAQEHELASAGYRVLAIAEGPLVLHAGESLTRERLRGLEFLGLVGMSDPLRPEARGAVQACRHAGIAVSMVTGDHPVTALSIARDLGLAQDPGEVVTGAEIAQASAEGEQAVDALTAGARVFARIEPQQKLAIVQSMQRNGHFVAVTGDGVNDAPALRAAQVGVAMGASGTDVARETAELVLADDNFASIVAGIEEGRVTYANVRKVIFLLISTGAAEIVLFALALAANVPLPLLAVQLLWLNLVTNGIQDVALAFEPAEGGELARPPRAPGEPIFDRLMIERVLLSALVIGGLAFGAYHRMLSHGMPVEQARNATLLLMVLFENIQAFNSRSESLSVFRHNLLRNKLLLFGTLAAQLVHIAAMYAPGLSNLLRLQPVATSLWFELLGLALMMLVVMEAHKWLRRTSGRCDATAAH